MTKKPVKTRVEEHERERFKGKVDSVSQYLRGVIYDVIENGTDGYREKTEEHRRLRGEVVELEGRESVVEERIEALEEELEEIRREKQRKQERVEELEEEFSEGGSGDSADGGVDSPGSDVDEVARELLRSVVDGEVGTNGVVPEMKEVQQAAVRADVDPAEVIEAMRREAAPARESEYAGVVEGDAVRRAFRRSSDDVQALSEATFENVRAAVAEEVFDEEFGG